MAELMPEETNIRLIGLADNGVRHLTNAQRATVSPEDMAGLRIRGQPSRVFVSLIDALGASATPVPRGALPGAPSPEQLAAFAERAQPTVRG